MRSESEMLDLLLETARRDERIRAVIMNGSRANPNAPRDPLQDFDIVYLVTDLVPFRRNFEWIKRFGEIMILQLPDELQDPPPPAGSGFAYLMQFTDGNRIDLGIYPLDQLDVVRQDSLSLLLLDKDGLVGPLPPASERDYLPKPPTAKEFSDCCNEFWWVCPYVAKGLWREEITYARHMLDEVLREQLMRMLTWQIGVETGFSKNPGKFGKYFEKYLGQSRWEMLLRTYADAGAERTWDALGSMCALFRLAAQPVAAHFGFDYPDGDDKKVSAHLQRVRTLPRNAIEVY